MKIHSPRYIARCAVSFPSITWNLRGTSIMFMWPKMCESSPRRCAKVLRRRFKGSLEGVKERTGLPPLAVGCSTRSMASKYSRCTRTLLAQGPNTHLRLSLYLTRAHTSRIVRCRGSLHTTHALGSCETTTPLCLRAPPPSDSCVRL